VVKVRRRIHTPAAGRDLGLSTLFVKHSLDGRGLLLRFAATSYSLRVVQMLKSRCSSMSHGTASDTVGTTSTAAAAR
jgi:hypothetical protein